MATVLVHHEVSNYDTWKAAFDSGAEKREAKGITHIQAGRHMQNPNHVYMVFEVADASVLHDHLGHSETKSMQDTGGIIGENHVIILS